MTTEAPSKPRLGIVYGLSVTFVDWAKNNGYSRLIKDIEGALDEYRQGYQRLKKIASVEKAIQHQRDRLAKMQAGLEALKGTD